MLSNLFFALLKINIMATIVALIVLSFKSILKKCGASRKILFYLWIIIGLRFVCPTFIESNFSLFNLVDTSTSSENHILISQMNFSESQNSDMNFEVNNIVHDDLEFVIESDETIESIEPEIIPLQVPKEEAKITDILMIIWLTGSFMLISYALISYIKLKRTVMFAIKGNGEYYETDMISTPCVLGVIKPKVYLTLNLNDEEKKYILAHENTHINRKDYFTKLIAYLILSLHWMNPISWILFRLFVNDMEMLCDEESIEKIGEENKVGYMESLVKLSSGNMRNILPCPIAFSENNTEKRVKNMINYKKSGIIISIVALTVCILLTIVCLTNRNVHDINIVQQGSYSLFNYDYIIKGKKVSLFVDSISTEEYDELIELLYPKGIVDEQGQEIGIIENSTEVRENFINEHTKAYTVIDGATQEVELEKFYITLREISISFEEENYLFYKAVIGEDVFVFPSEWGSLPFGFIEDGEENSYYIYGNLGIWKIDTEKLSLDKITSDEYNGKTYSDLMNEIGNNDTSDNDGFLVWIDQAVISPNNDYIVYRSNRGSENLNETSIWKIDLKTRKEEKVLVENLYNDIIGFASENVIVVGSTGNTRLVNLKTLKVQDVKIPQVENMAVQSVRNGKLLYSTYKDGDEYTTIILNEINFETGELAELQRFDECYSNLGNAEGISFNDMLYFQNDVDNGHYSWRLKPEDVVSEYWHVLFGISDGEISDIKYTGLNECMVFYSLNNKEYVLTLIRPIKKDDTGIWIVKDCKTRVVSNYEEVIYINALKDLYYNHILPDGTEFEDYKYMDNYDMAENSFAICDVDNDGKKELLIAFSHYPMAAMRTTIYDYDPVTNKFREQLTDFNWMNFYYNGILEAMWSHNQGTAGDALWPYTMYKYEPETDSYSIVAWVDAWDKLYGETSYILDMFDEFPKEVDEDNDGIVYFVTPKGEIEFQKFMDYKEYNEWRESYISSETKEIEVSYINFTEENINSLVNK